MSVPPWVPKNGTPDSRHLQELSNFIAREWPKLVALASGGTLQTAAPDAGSVLIESTAPTDEIQEAQVSFDDADGHTHTGADGSGTPIPLSGDLSGDNTAATVAQIEGVPIPAPGPGDDGKAIVYDNTGPAFAYEAILGAGSRSRQTVDGFYANAVAAALTNVDLSRDASAAPQGFLPVTGGSLTGVLVKSDTPVTAGTLTVEVYKNGAGTGLTAQLNTTDTTMKVTTQAAGLDPFVAGDRLEIVVSTAVGFLPITANIRASLEVEYGIDAA